jgi:hypothetical protein
MINAFTVERPAGEKQKPGQRSGPGRLALAEFIKRPQADSNRRQTKNYTCGERPSTSAVNVPKPG